MNPGDFAFVMATGIISMGTFLLGSSWLSQALLVIASIGFVVLIVALVIRLARYRSRVAADFRAPERVFGFFAVSASCDLLGTRFASAGHPMVTTVLACLAATVWLVLTYGVPATRLLDGPRESVLGGVDGTWLLWVVATQSLSTDASTLVPVWPSQSRLLATAAVALWSVGLVLYLLLVSLILLRWLTVAMTPAALSPAYWILMGATGITVLAGTDILNLPATFPAVRAIAGFAEGVCFVFWSFGTWWIPLLVVLGFGRHVLRKWPLRYEPTLWAVVFPIGMYSVATLTFGKAVGLSFMEPLGRGLLWVAFAAWLLVAAAFLARLARRRTAARHIADLTGAS
ncbi:MAG TPA: tellurite resistance/C4-dicarboxylate transporter family protein [Lentzea sp.]